MELYEGYETERWQGQAACRGVADNTGSFYPFYGPPAEGSRSRELRVARAKAFCGSCAVREECLNFALSKPDNDGVWGGLDEPERRLLRRRGRR